MKKVLKWIGIVLGSLVALLVIAGLGLSFSTTTRLNETYDIQPEKLAIPTDQASLAEGERLVSIYCEGCLARPRRRDGGGQRKIVKLLSVLLSRFF